MSKIKKALFLVLGLILTGVGIIGIFLPVLPTTPILLLASYCFVKSSEKLNNWLLNHKVFGRYIKDYSRYKAVDMKSKRLAIILIWVSMAVSIFLVDKLFVRVILILIGIGVTYHILSLKTLTPELRESMDRARVNVPNEG